MLQEIDTKYNGILILACTNKVEDIDSAIISRFQVSTCYEVCIKEIEMIHRLFLVIPMYCQSSSPAVQ